MAKTNVKTNEKATGSGKVFKAPIKPRKFKAGTDLSKNVK